MVDMIDMVFVVGLIVHGHNFLHNCCALKSMSQTAQIYQIDPNWSSCIVFPVFQSLVAAAIQIRYSRNVAPLQWLHAVVASQVRLHQAHS